MSEKDKANKGRNRPSFNQKKNHKHKGSSNEWLYGLHSVEAALRNPKRKCKRLLATQNAYQKLQSVVSLDNVSVEIVNPKDLDKLLGQDAVHQGVVLDALPLPMLHIEELRDISPILVLDQVTDPHNVGAIVRSAAAFNVGALVMTERHSPNFSGVLAKTACGGLEHLPICLVGNLSRALDTLADNGYWRIGLDGEGVECLEDISHQGSLALVLGAEGKGLRRLTKEHCDIIARIKTASNLTSLNVSNAAAISLHSVYLNTKS